MSKEAMKRTVDKIKSTFWEGYLPEPVKCKYPKCKYPCSDLPDCRDAQQALDKKAENARELGLDYEPAQQEPVAYWIPKAEQFCIADPSGRPFAKAWEPLYTSPPTPAQRTWVGLTDEEIDDCWNNLFGTGNYNRRNVYQAIEAKLKEKNT